MKSPIRFSIVLTTIFCFSFLIPNAYALSPTDPVITNHTDIKEGAWKAKMKGGQLCIEFVADNAMLWSWASCLDKTLVDNIENIDKEEVNLTRDRGTFVLSGKWNGKKGKGTYRFDPSEKFVTSHPSGSELSDKDIIDLFMNDIARESELINEMRGLYNPTQELDLTNHLRTFPGLTVRGERGNARLLIRGVGSLSTSNEPLMILDNGPVGDYQTLYNAVNVGDIKRIEVLKNPNDVAIYGVRGMNGVIKITTAMN